MAYKITKTKIGYQVKDTVSGAIKAKGTTKLKAENQVKLLERFAGAKKQTGKGSLLSKKKKISDEEEKKEVEVVEIAPNNPPIDFHISEGLFNKHNEIFERGNAPRVRMITKARKVLGEEATDPFYSRRMYSRKSIDDLNLHEEPETYGEELKRIAKEKALLKKEYNIAYMKKMEKKLYKSMKDKQIRLGGRGK
jgi:hypothetical protein